MSMSIEPTPAERRHDWLRNPFARVSGGERTRIASCAVATRMARAQQAARAAPMAAA